MNERQILHRPVVGNDAATWSVAETGDFNGDGKTDILWRNSNGDVEMWFMNGTQISQQSDSSTFQRAGRSKALEPIEEATTQRHSLGVLPSLPAGFSQK